MYIPENADMKTRYKVSLGFEGRAVVEIEADTPELARQKAYELQVEDLARQGAADILALKIVPRDIREASITAGENLGEEEDRPIGKRPSGWYRPPEG
jgi:hypothetical protein